MNNEEIGTVNEMLCEFTKGNPGALRVCFELMEHFQDSSVIVFVLMKQQGIFASDIWDLYKSCNHSIPAFYDALLGNTAIKQLEAVPGSSFWKPTKEWEEEREKE